MSPPGAELLAAALQCDRRLALCHCRRFWLRIPSLRAPPSPPPPPNGKMLA